MSPNPFMPSPAPRTSRAPKISKVCKAVDLSGVKYISYDKQRGRYKVQLNINLGNFQTLEDAKVARDVMLAKIKPWLAVNKVTAKKKFILGDL